MSDAEKVVKVVKVQCLQKPQCLQRLLLRKLVHLLQTLAHLQKKRPLQHLVATTPRL